MNNTTSIALDFSPEEHATICRAADEQGLTVQDLVSTAALILTAEAEACLNDCPSPGCARLCR